jgi:hypothetical protein
MELAKIVYMGAFSCVSMFAYTSGSVFVSGVVYG